MFVCSVVRERITPSLLASCCVIDAPLDNRLVIVGHFAHLCLCDVLLFSGQQELVKHTHDATDKSNLRMALDAMKVKLLACFPPLKKVLLQHC